MGRIKRFPRPLFEKVSEYHWEPVRLTGAALPEFARSINEDVPCDFIASGERICASPPPTLNRCDGDTYPSDRIRDGVLVGGMDVIRCYPGGKVPFKRDWYAIVASPSDEENLLVDGPKIEKERHHFQEFPHPRVKITII